MECRGPNESEASMGLRVDVELDHDIGEKLRQLATGHGRTLAEEAGELLRGAVLAVQPPASAEGLGSSMVALFSGSGVGLTEHESEAIELRGHPVEPLTFDR
jgi:hypothetical protein